MRGDFTLSKNNGNNASSVAEFGIGFNHSIPMILNVLSHCLFRGKKSFLYFKFIVMVNPIPPLEVHDYC